MQGARLSGPISIVLLVIGLACCVSNSDSESAAQQQSAVQVDDWDNTVLPDVPGAPNGDWLSLGLHPILDCIGLDSRGHLVAYFGATNDGTTVLTIPVGPFNSFVPPPLDRGQPTAFAPGRHDNVVSVALGPRNSPVEWKLAHRHAVALKNAPQCIPIFAGATSATAMSNAVVSLTWSPASDYAAPASAIVYDVCVSTTSGACATHFVVKQTTSPGVTTSNLTGLMAGTTYYIVVRARNPMGGEDANTVQVSATTCEGRQTACGGLCTVLATDPANCGACGVACANGLCGAGTCCTTGQVLCNGLCATLASDPANCGGCGNACPSGNVCSNGQCCSSGQTRCSDMCASLATDPGNCGACGNACPLGDVCSNGQCACPGPNIVCNGACTSLLSDPLNCGACGNVCPNGDVCSNGECGCTPPYVSCYGTCRALDSDPANCGTCFNECPLGDECSNSQCVCPSPNTVCNGVCTSLAIDPANCGGCGNACPSGNVCSDGQCSCPAWNTVCNGVCTSLAIDSANCGACGNACQGFLTCSQGECSCPSGGSSPFSQYAVCNGICTSLTGNPVFGEYPRNTANCGQCGHACLGDAVCWQGECNCLSFSDLLCNGVCIPPGDAQNCGACGRACPVGATCVVLEWCPCPGTSMPVECECPANAIVCSGTSEGGTSESGGAGGACTFVLSDPANCGTCGNVCPSGTQNCVDGTCSSTVCPSSGVLCEGQCLPPLRLATDPNNCGACGNVCAPDQTCQAGACSPCSSEGLGHAACPGPDGGLACTYLLGDPNNCGSCGNFCPASELCTNGICTPCSSQGAGYAACPGGTDGLECTYLPSDPANCGACGNACPSQTCVNGVCGVMFCPPPSVICDGGCLDWFLIPVDPNNCGACGNVCAVGLGCMGGTCVPCRAWGSGTAVCPGPDGEQVCPDLLTDPTNCGACGNACQVGEGCVSGVCGPCSSQAPGYAACHGPDGGLVCTYLSSDPANCGDCGNACPAGENCVTGGCTACTTSTIGYATCQRPDGGLVCSYELTDPANCGLCGNVCPSGTTCQAGVCR